MEGEEFRVRAVEMADYIVSYLNNISSRRVTPGVEPGYLARLLPSSPPHHPEAWDDIMKDVEDKIMVGMTHWQHPRFHAYFPAGNSYPSILADMLSDAIGCVGFSWSAAPACTELETLVLDWLAKMVVLPKQFMSSSAGSRGGGVIQSSASECVLDCLLAARTHAIKTFKMENEVEDDTVILSKLTAYCSKEAHSSVEKAAMIAFVKLRIIEPDESGVFRGHSLEKAMKEDMEKGLYPFFVSATLGSTGICAFDRLDEMGPVCMEVGAWLHVDAAYAGSAFICPEYRHLMKGVECANSFSINPNKWMLVNFDCSAMWVKDKYKLMQAFDVNQLYLQHKHEAKAVDYRHWGIPLSRRFRSLKLWFVIRNYGVSGLQAYIREHCRLARRFQVKVKEDPRFIIINDVKMALVCFRLKGSNKLTIKLLDMINTTGKLHLVPASFKDIFVIRFCVCAENAKEEDIDTAWNIISNIASDMLKSEGIHKTLPMFKTNQLAIVEEGPLRGFSGAKPWSYNCFVKNKQVQTLYNPRAFCTFSIY